MGLIHDESFTVQVLTPDGWRYIHAPGTWQDNWPWILTKDDRVKVSIKDPVGGPEVARQAVARGLVEAGTPWRVLASKWGKTWVVREGVAGD